MSQPLRVIIRGMGASVPSEVLDNEFFSSYLDTSDAWILPRTGIRQRRRAAEGESTLTLALEASQRALANAGMSADQLDLIVVCTVTPETPLPSTACWLQEKLGISGRGIAAYDLVAACSGFVYGVVTAGLMMEAGAFQNVLVIGVETLTRITDYQDRATCILFGDGAGAAVLSPSPDPQRGIIHWELGADGSKAKAVWIPGGGSKEPASTRTVNERLHYMRMNGRELFKFAVLKLQELIDSALEKTGIAADQIKLIIPHQSNRRIMESARDRVGLSPEKMAINIDRYGNTSAASIPLALDEAWQAGKVGPGDLVLLVAFGGGVTWGSALMRL
jgi:3-oxoacyl-[acyl-carrier-protein] synthase-3